MPAAPHPKLRSAGAKSGSLRENGKAGQSPKKPICEWAGAHPPKPRPAKRPKTVGRRWLELRAKIEERRSRNSEVAR